eukprot:753292-Hanusia_phi.AAC.2
MVVSLLSDFHFVLSPPLPLLLFPSPSLLRSRDMAAATILSSSPLTSTESENPEASGSGPAARRRRPGPLPQWALGVAPNQRGGPAHP